MSKKSILIFLIIHLFSFVLARAETVKVMIMDGGIETSHRLLKRVKSIRSFSTSPLEPSPLNVHGTHITGLVLYGPMGYPADTTDELCSEIEVITCQVFFEGFSDRDFFKNEAYCFNYALENNVKYINISGGGSNYSDQEYMFLLNLKKNGTKVIAAAGNNGKDIKNDPYYPASLQDRLDNIIAVGNVENNGDWAKTSSYGNNVVKVKGQNILSTAPISVGSYNFLSGSSMSTAVHTHDLLKKECQRIHNNPKSIGKIWAM